MTKYVPVKIAHDVFEPSDGADDSLSPVIFLHGATAYKEMWMDFPQLVADGSKRKVYAIDARNHGDSEYTEVFDFDINADDLLHFMDSSDIQKAILIGHSMGGITSIKTALKKPERVEMIFPIDMFTKKMPAEFLGAVEGFIGMVIECVKIIPKELDDEGATAFLIDYIYNMTPKDSPFLTPKEKMQGIRMKFNRTAEGDFDVRFNKDVVMAALKNPETLMSEPSGQYDGPAYFIYGSLSPFNVGKEEEDIKKHFPRAEMIEFENATHNVPFEFKEKFIETVLQRMC